MPLADIVGLIIGTSVTVAVFSYLLGDNFIYRLVLHLFTGALMGYTFALLIVEVGFRMIIPQLLTQDLLVAISLLLGLTLFVFKAIKSPLSFVGNYPLAFLIGVGIAIGLWGALAGTLWPQLQATGSAVSIDIQSPTPLIDLVKGITIVGGTICTLLIFDSTLISRIQRGPVALLSRLINIIGRFFLTVALGAAFAGALTASLTFFIGRVQYIIDALATIIAG